MDREDRFGRRKKKRRKGGLGMGGGGGSMMPPIRSFELPSEEELEREAAELEKVIAAAAPGSLQTVSIAELQQMEIEGLHALAKQEGFTEFEESSKHDLIFKLLKARAARQGLMVGEGTRTSPYTTWLFGSQWHCRGLGALSGRPTEGVEN